MKRWSGRAKVGIALIVVQAMAYFGSIINGDFLDMKLVEFVGYNIPLIIGIILIATGRKRGER